ncbi:beta-ketoacyl synthase N-terminal-like domain-containing protein [Pseudomonas lini]
MVATSWSDESYFVTGMSEKKPMHQGAIHSKAIRRVNKLLNWQQLFAFGGPALSVDTACSSFPYAIDMAKALINSGQADNAIVMALNTVLPPALFLGFSQLTAFFLPGPNAGVRPGR